VDSLGYYITRNFESHTGHLAGYIDYIMRAARRVCIRLGCEKQKGKHLVKRNVNIEMGFSDTGCEGAGQASCLVSSFGAAVSDLAYCTTMVLN
jgi:hypothetical protein